MGNDSTGNEPTPTTSKKPAAPKAAAASAVTKKKNLSKSDKRKPVRLDSPRWLVPTMVAAFIIGLVWIVAYYIAPDAPVISTLGWWNVLVGFGFFAVGFVLSTKWK
jgi:hypothetical protein